MYIQRLFYSLIVAFSFFLVSFDSYDSRAETELYEQNDSLALIAGRNLPIPYRPLTDLEWEKISPFLLPDDHPIKNSLDTIFSQSRVSTSLSSIRKAGFKILGKGKYSKTIVAKHKDLQGYIIKMIPDNNQSDDITKLTNRIIGVGIAKDIITRNGYEKWMKVPNKWLYVLPSSPAPSNPYPKHIILVAEDMDIYPKKKSYSMWKGEEMTPEKLNAIYLLLTEGGFHDIIYPFNMPFAKDGRIAFIDTEQYWGLISYHKLVRYLGPETTAHWQMLIDRGGPW